jgi:hypothetical protein
LTLGAAHRATGAAAPPPSPDPGEQAVRAVSSSSTCCGTPLTITSSRRTTSAASPTAGRAPAAGTPLPTVSATPSHCRRCPARAGPRDHAGQPRRRPRKRRVHTFSQADRRRLADSNTALWLHAHARAPERALARLCGRAYGSAQRGSGRVAVLPGWLTVAVGRAVAGRLATGNWAARPVLARGALWIFNSFLFIETI